MSTPAGITRIPCTSGAFSAMESGSDLGAIITVAATRPALVWSATGEVLLADPYTLTVAPGEEISIPLIPTDLTGWTLNGLPLDLAEGEHSHGYTITVQATLTSDGATRKVGNPLTYTRVVVPADTVGALDLDAALSTTAATGGTLTLPALAVALLAAIERAEALGASYDSAVAEALASGPLTGAEVAARLPSRADVPARPAARAMGLGDSITADGTTLPTSSADFVHNSDYSWLMWASLLSMGRIEFAGVAATATFRTDQIIATHLPTVLAARPAFCPVHAGTNDVGNLTTAQTLANLKFIFDTLLAAGITPVGTTMLPKETLTSSSRQPLDAMSAFIVRYGRLRGFPVVDWTTPFIDPDGSWKSYTSPTPGLYNRDDTHPNGAGAKIMGQRVLDALAPFLPPAPGPLATSVNFLSDFSLAKTNGLLLTDTNADGVADNVIAAAATGAQYTLTPMTESEGRGNWQNLKRTSTGSPVINTAHTPIPAGNRVRVSCKVKTSGIVAGNGVWHLRWATDTPTDVAALRSQRQDVTLGLFSREFVMPTIAGHQNLKLYAYIDGGAGELSVGEIQMVDLTARGIA